MKITSCYTVPIKRQLFEASGALRPGHVDDALMRATSTVCLEALTFCADVWIREWEYLSSLPTALIGSALPRKRAADLLIHNTKDNAARYPEFDRRFPYLPAYTRRAIIADSLGLVSSYMSNHKNWEALSPTERGAEPTLGLPTRYELTFYKEDRDLRELDSGIIRLKLFDGKAWGWHRFTIAPSDARYISHLRDTRKLLSPVVEKVRGEYRIRFSFEESKTLVQNDNPLAYTILAVDLGINAAASWCVMTGDGTVHAKGVIHLSCEEDRLQHLMNRKRMYQQAGKKPKGIYRIVTAANRNLSIETCRAVMEIAVRYRADCLVFEHLDRADKKKGKRYAERIHMWRANDVQKRLEFQAHRHGMRISRICAWGTSKYAFDGSGLAKRDEHNYSICTFESGKRYNCDLSAAMNIGARYFLRGYAKDTACPPLPKTPQRTYATLRSLLSETAA